MGNFSKFFYHLLSANGDFSWHEEWWHNTYMYVIYVDTLAPFFLVVSFSSVVNS